MNTTEPDLEEQVAVTEQGDREVAMFRVGRGHGIRAVERLWARTFDLAWSRPPGMRRA